MLFPLCRIEQENRIEAKAKVVSRNVSLQKENIKSYISWQARNQVSSIKIDISSDKDVLLELYMVFYNVMIYASVYFCAKILKTELKL